MRSDDASRCTPLCGQQLPVSAAQRRWRGKRAVEGVQDQLCWPTGAQAIPSYIGVCSSFQIPAYASVGCAHGAGDPVLPGAGPHPGAWDFLSSLLPLLVAHRGSPAATSLLGHCCVAGREAMRGGNAMHLLLHPASCNQYSRYSGHASVPCQWKPARILIRFRMCAAGVNDSYIEHTFPLGRYVCHPGTAPACVVSSPAAIRSLGSPNNCAACCDPRRGCFTWSSSTRAGGPA